MHYALLFTVQSPLLLSQSKCPCIQVMLMSRAKSLNSYTDILDNVTILINFIASSFVKRQRLPVTLFAIKPLEISSLVAKPSRTNSQNLSYQICSRSTPCSNNWRRIPKPLHSLTISNCQSKFRGFLHSRFALSWFRTIILMTSVYSVCWNLADLSRTLAPSQSFTLTSRNKH